MADLLELTERGLYCSVGDFYIDPWRPVDKAIVTHAHADHLRWGMGQYLCSREGEGVTRVRVGKEATIQSIEYGEKVFINGVSVSLQPAGHILGSAQVRVEHQGEVWVFTGDYKLSSDATTTRYEPIRCHTFISESTFALPIYRWPDSVTVAEEINSWWQCNAEQGLCSVIYGYALGKAQRILSLLEPQTGPIFVHGSILALNDAYRQSGVKIPEVKRVSEAESKADFRRAMVVAPPSAAGSPWMRRFAPLSDGYVSGWMSVRGNRRRRSVDRGFVLSDHVDWPELLQAVNETGAERLRFTHGYSAVAARYFQDLGFDAEILETEFGEPELIDGELEGDEAVQ